MMKNATRFLAVWVVPLIVVATSNTVHATEIFPGYDLFATAASPPNPSTFVDLTVQSGGLVGVVPLMGNPFGPANTDTIVERKLGSGFPFNVGDNVTIPIELVALSLTSVAPINIGGLFYSMDVISGSLMGEPANPLGSMTVFHSVLNGGTFLTNTLPVNYKATFTEIGNPLNTFFVPGSILFQNTNGVWSHTPGPMDQHGGPYPAGGFYAGIDPHTGQKVIMAHVTPDEAHYTDPACPEPSTFALAVLGMISLRFVPWRTRRRA